MHKNHTAVTVVRNAVCTEFTNVLQTSINFSRVTFDGLANNGICKNTCQIYSLENWLQWIHRPGEFLTKNNGKKNWDEPSATYGIFFQINCMQLLSGWINFPQVTWFSVTISLKYLLKLVIVFDRHVQLKSNGCEMCSARPRTSNWNL